MLAGLSLPRPLSSARRWQPSLRVLTRPFLRACSSLRLSLLVEGHQSYWVKDHTCTTSFNPNYFFKSPVPNHTPILRNWGLGPQHVSLGEIEFSPQHRARGADSSPAPCPCQRGSRRAPHGPRDAGFVQIPEMTVPQLQDRLVTPPLRPWPGCTDSDLWLRLRFLSHRLLNQR